MKEGGFEDVERNMRILLEASAILWKAVITGEKWEFNGSFQETDVAKLFPMDICNFLKWCIQGQTGMKMTSAKQDINGLKKAHKLLQFL